MKNMLWVSALILLAFSAGCSDDDASPCDPCTDDRNSIDLARTYWFLPSVPIEDRGPLAESRAPDNRWFLPHDPVLARYLNPDLEGEARNEIIETLDLFLRAEGTTWASDDWGGIMTGNIPPELSLGLIQYVEIWINDGIVDPGERSGTVHFNMGAISEDGFWPLDQEGQFVVGQFDQEDGILPDTQPDGVWTHEEDVGLDYRNQSDNEYSAEYGSASNPYPQINNTKANNREDSEDLNLNGIFDTDNSYMAQSIDLNSTEAEVDVLRDYENVSDLFEEGISWRLFRLPLASFEMDNEKGDPPTPMVFSHIRVWFEDPDRTPEKTRVHLQIGGIRFVEE